MFDTQTAVAWLATLALPVPLEPAIVGQVLPDYPDRVGFVTLTGGGPVTNDGMFEAAGFQLRVRGRQGDPFDAERLANDCDHRIRTALMPVVVAVTDTYLHWVARAGGRPSPLTPGGNPGRRSEFVCTYLVGASLDP